jgi:hypothetical protein
MEFSSKKIFLDLKDKSKILNLSLQISKMISILIENQSNLSIYMAPINDCILIINQKYNFKFLSQRINNTFRDLLIKNSQDFLCQNLSQVVNPKLIIIDENNYNDILFPIDFSKNLRVEIIERQNPYYGELIDSETKLLLFNLPILDFFVATGKKLNQKVYMILKKMILKL